MEVKPGYKQTEVGVIPEDWDVALLANEIDRLDAGVSVNSDSESSVSDGYEPSVLKTSAVVNGKFLPSEAKKIIPSDVNRAKLSPVRDSIIISRMNTPDLIGECGYVAKNHPYLFLPDRLWMTHTKSGSDICIRWLSYVLSSPPYKARITGLATGTSGSMKNIAKNALLAISIPYPKPEEQRAIATALCDMDTLLDGLDLLIAKKRAIKQATMQQLLTGQTRLPGFSGEWVQYSIAELERRNVLKLGRGSVISKKDIEAAPGEYPIYSSSIHNEGEFGRYGKFMFDEELVTWSVDGGGNFFYRNRHRFSVTNVCGYMRADTTRLSHRFLAAQLQCKHAEKSFDYQIKAHPSVVRSEYPVDVPCIEEQTAIAIILSDMDAEITALETRRTKIRALKQAMMQELLTGRTRLVAPASEASGKVVNIPTEKAKAKTKAHNWQINEAVVISILASRFGSEQYPLGRKRCTKLAYLLHRHVEHVAQGFRKKAAGPYNPDVKYKGPEGIAQKNGYIRPHRNGNFSGFVAADNIVQAQAYFTDWYGQEVLDWLEQFRKKTNDELELLTTVDMSAEDLRQKGSTVNLENVKSLIATHPEWKAKLEREIFSDFNIRRAIHHLRELFAEQG